QRAAGRCAVFRQEEIATLASVANLYSVNERSTTRGRFHRWQDRHRTDSVDVQPQATRLVGTIRVGARGLDDMKGALMVVAGHKLCASVGIEIADGDATVMP